MFRKPKRKVKNLRKKTEEEKGEDTTATDNNEDGDETTSELLQEARKRVKTTTSTSTAAAASSTSASKKSSSDLMHTFKTTNNEDESSSPSRNLVTSTADHHPDAVAKDDSAAAATARPDDGIFRNTERNKFHAGPIRAAAHVRVTTRFDYEPSICKDYKETGFCGFGDTCIYLHDRSDTLSGWQLEQQYEQQAAQEKAKQQQAAILNDFASGATKAGDDEKAQSINTNDGIPFACHLCRSHFKDPVVTNCGHYFCETCIMAHVRGAASKGACPICQKDTGRVFNQPTKLLTKKRKVLGTQASKARDSWEQYAKAFSESKEK